MSNYLSKKNKKKNTTQPVIIKKKNKRNRFTYTFRIESFHKNNMVVGGEILTKITSEYDNSYINPESHFANLGNDDVIFFLKKLQNHIKKFYLKSKLHNLSINLNPEWLINSYIATFLKEFIDNVIKFNINIIFELSESSNIYHNHINELNDEIRYFSEKGVIFYLDDFGYKNSNFCLLRELKISGIKMDKNLFWELFNTDKDLLSSLLIYMKNKFNNVVVEGVEEAKHFNFLNDKDCIQQGYFFKNS